MSSESYTKLAPTGDGDGISSSKSKVSMEWKDLNYYVRVKNSSKSTFFKPVYQNNHILRGVTGSAESGQLLAIMGPTGCGKTSLLNVLASRMSASGSENMKLSGSVYLNGKLRKDNSFRKLSAYVLQDDKLYPHLTVYETLYLAAQFYLPTDMSAEEKQKNIMEVITELGLLKAKDTIIGDEKTRGVSGGERKRANIATQMISKPTILFLDEPTSGLDAFQSQSVMDCMKSMAKMGRLIITVIHQPRSSIYNMFDKLLLLSLGQVMYMGDAVNAVDYFSAQGFNCPDAFNPSDYFLDILSPDTRSEASDASSHAQIALLASKWQEAQSSSEKSVSITNADGEAASYVDVVPIQSEPFGNRFQRNFKLLAWRAFTEQRRDIATIGIKCFFTLFFGSILGGIYSKNHNDQRGISDITGLMFVVSINQAFNSVIACLNTFPKEKIIINRERSANAYTAVEYFSSKWIVELPINIFPSLLYAIVLYFSANLRTAKFGIFVLILMLETVTGISLGLAIGALMPNLEAALGIGPPMVIIALIFGGFYINLSTLPVVANLIPYLSFIKWTFEALCINQFLGQTFDCAGTVSGACEQTGEAVLQRLGFGGKEVSDAVLGLSMLLIGFTLSAVWFLERSQLQFIPLGHTGRNMADTSKVE